jgi:hypothetical protein
MGDDEIFEPNEFAGEEEKNTPQTELDGAKHQITLDDLNLKEIWKADDNDLRVIRGLGKFLSGEAGYRAETFPDFLKGTEPYQAVIRRGTGGDGLNAKTLLAIIMELEHVQKLGNVAEHTGSLADGKDTGLNVLRRIVVPILVPDLGVYAGWKGYQLSNEIANENDCEKKEKKIMEYTRIWVMDKLADDGQMSYLVQALEDRTAQSSMPTDKVILSSRKR